MTRIALDQEFYPASMFPYCVKVDAQGKIVKHGFLDDVLGTTPLVSNNQDVTTDPTIAGHVTATKTEDGLIQLSLGTLDGIEPNQILDVLRDGKRIGRFRVVLFA